MKPIATRKLWISTVILGTFAALGVAIVAYTFTITEAVIAESERQALLAQFHELLPPPYYDNDLLEDTVQITDLAMLGTGDPITVYRAYRQGQPVAVFATPVAAGYGGSIKLLVAVKVNGELIGVRTLTSKETPGLGDGIELSRSDWILGFNDRSLGDPELDDWRLEKFGGVFDQLTGATITSSAVVNEVRKFLMYFERTKKRLFKAKNSNESD